jgi:hypothetical protein
MASEIGVLDIKPEDVTAIEPGKMFLVDMNEGRIEDDEIKDAIVTKRHENG